MGFLWLSTVRGAIHDVNSRYGASQNHCRRLEKSRNPDNGPACDLLAKCAVKCRQALEIDGDGIGVFASRKLVVQVQLGPARAYLAFLEVRDVEDLSTDEDVQGGTDPNTNRSGRTSRHGWLQSIDTGNGACYYMPCCWLRESVTVTPMLEKPLSAAEAAEWLMQVVMPFWSFSDLHNCIQSFPYEIHTYIQWLVVWCKSCPVEDKPHWYMRWCISVANMPGHLCIQAAEPYILLWKCTWPKCTHWNTFGDSHLQKGMLSGN